MHHWAGPEFIRPCNCLLQGVFPSFLLCTICLSQEICCKFGLKIRMFGSQVVFILSRQKVSPLAAKFNHFSGVRALFPSRLCSRIDESLILEARKIETTGERNLHSQNSPVELYACNDGTAAAAAVHV